MTKKSWVMGINAVLLMASLRPTAADTVRLDPTSNRFDRRIPSSADFTLDVPVPGKEFLRGELEVWPASSSGACNTPDDGPQHYKLAMVSNGTEADRVLRATVPALQVNTRFCFSVTITRGLDEIAAVGFAANVVSEIMKVSFDTECRNIDNLRSRLKAEVSAKIVKVTKDRRDSSKLSMRADVRQLTTWSSAKTESASSRAIANTIVDGMDLESLCEALLKASGSAKNASDTAEKTKTALLAARTSLDPGGTVALLQTNRVQAKLPLWVSGTGTNLEVRRFVDVTDQEVSLTSAAQALEPISAELAELLRDIRDAKAADRKPLRKAFQDALEKLPTRPATLVYASGTTRLQMTIDELFQVSATPPETRDARLAANREIIVKNLDLLKRQMATYQRDDPQAKPWFDALDNQHAAEVAYESAKTELEEKLDTLNGSRQLIATKLKERLVSADVRGLVVSVSAIKSAQKIVAPETDAGASSVAADIGVLVALPFHVSRDRDDWEPWLVPYAGVNIYASRVDRVVPFDQLVGSFVKQRMSLTLGALLTRPMLNGESISMPFRNSGLIPVAAIGVRLTSFTRFTVGGFAFDYRDPNPASDKTHRGGAVWLGLSIDADVWAAIQGKAFK